MGNSCEQSAATLEAAGPFLPLLGCTPAFGEGACEPVAAGVGRIKETLLSSVLEGPGLQRPRQLGSNLDSGLTQVSCVELQGRTAHGVQYGSPWPCARRFFPNSPAHGKCSMNHGFANISKCHRPGLYGGRFTIRCWGGKRRSSGVFLNSFQHPQALSALLPGSGLAPSH